MLKNFRAQKTFRKTFCIISRIFSFESRSRSAFESRSRSARVKTSKNTKIGNAQQSVRKTAISFNRLLKYISIHTQINRKSSERRHLVYAARFDIIVFYT